MDEPRPQIQMCSFCKNHGKFVSRKGHKECPHKDCKCEQCSVVLNLNQIRRQQYWEKVLQKSHLSQDKGTDSTSDSTISGGSSKPIDLTSSKKEYSGSFPSSGSVGEDEKNKIVDLTSQSWTPVRIKQEPLFRKTLSEILPSSKPIPPEIGHHIYKTQTKTEPTEITRSYFGPSSGASLSTPPRQDVSFVQTRPLPKPDEGNKYTKAPELNVNNKPKSSTDAKCKSPHRVEATSSVSSPEARSTAVKTRTEDKPGKTKHKELNPRKKSTSKPKETRNMRDYHRSVAEAPSSVSSRSIFGKALDLCTSIVSYVSGKGSEPSSKDSRDIPRVESKGRNKAGNKRKAEDSSVEIIRKKSKRFCPKCGENVGNMDNFCGECCCRL